MNRQNNKTERKKTISDTLFTAFMLFTATAVSFCFFHLGNKNSANITVIYTLVISVIASIPKNVTGYPSNEKLNLKNG